MRIFSIFKSISGELGLFYPGSPTIFIRFAGCPLRCAWCDTVSATPKKSGQEMSVEAVLACVRELSGGGIIEQVLITGGEPLFQKQAFEELVVALIEMPGNDFLVQVETSGACFPSSDIRRCVDWWVVDYKVPSSGEERKMRLSNFWKFGNRCSIKFPCQDRTDFERALNVMDELRLYSPFIHETPGRVLLSPVYPLAATELIQWQEEAAQTRPWLRTAMVNVQLHKLLGLVEDQEKGVK